MPEEKVKKERKYFPSFSELCDRLVITQLKEFLIPEHRDKYAEEIKQIMNDIDINIEEHDVKLDAKLVRALMLLVVYNREIWLNEANCRKGLKEGNDLSKSHALNSGRAVCKNKIQEKIGGRLDYKVDNAAEYPEWIPSWD